MKSLKFVIILIVAVLVFIISFIIGCNLREKLDAKGDNIIENKDVSVNVLKTDKFETSGLFELADGTSRYEADLVANDMFWNSKVRLYHKIITNKEDYNKYKERVPQLPEIANINFEKEFVIILVNENVRDKNEDNLYISDVNLSNDVTNIYLKQKEEVNQSNRYNGWYAIVDKTQLSENINIIVNDNVKE